MIIMIVLKTLLSLLLLLQLRLRLFERLPSVGHLTVFFIRCPNIMVTVPYGKVPFLCF